MGRRAGAVLSLLVIVMLCSCRCEPLPSRRELQTVIAHSGSSFLPLHRPLLPVLGTTGAGVAVSISAGPPTEKASGSGNGNSGANMQGAADAAVASCLKSVTENDAGMRAFTWMLFTTHACAATNEVGCKALLAAGKVPFTSEADVRRALEAAAASVKTCVANNGRALKAWGLDLAGRNPALDVPTLDRICSNAKKYAQSGKTLPELDDFGILDGVAAVATGISQATLATVTGLAVKTPVSVIGANFGVGWVFDKLFHQKNAKECQALYSDQGCAELANVDTFQLEAMVNTWATGPTPPGSAGAPAPRVDPAVLAWGKSDACKTCTRNLEAVCSNHVAEYTQQFKQVATMSNAVGLVAGGLTRLQALAASAGGAGFLDKAMALVVTPVWQGWVGGQAAVGRPDWFKKTSLDVLQAAEKWRYRQGVPKGPILDTAFSQGHTVKVTPAPVKAPEPPKPTPQVTTPQPQATISQGPTAKVTPAPVKAPEPPKVQAGPAPPPKGPTGPAPYTVGGSSFVLCPCTNTPCNAPVGGGMGVRMVGTNDCLNCFASYPCPQGMACQPGKPSAGAQPSETFSTCV